MDFGRDLRHILHRFMDADLVIKDSNYKCRNLWLGVIPYYFYCARKSAKAINNDLPFLFKICVRKVYSYCCFVLISVYFCCKTV